MSTTEHPVAGAMRTTLPQVLPYPIDQLVHRNGGHGPGYVQRGSKLDAGVLRLGPGRSSVNHFHLRLDEVFLVLEGSATMWLDTRVAVRLGPGDSYFSPAGEFHYFLNEGSDVFRAFFVKSPFDPADTNELPWSPDQGPLTCEELQRFRDEVAARRMRAASPKSS